jgi:hypothetical protein
MNNYPNKPTWVGRGQIAGGVGTSGQTIRYATLQNTGRASYLALDPNTGAIAAWLNGCDSPGAFRSKKFLFIYNFDFFTGRNSTAITANAWQVFQSTTEKPLNDVCDTTPIFTTKVDGSAPGPYPSALGPFNAHGMQGCVYLGTKDQPGNVVCPNRNIQCEKFTVKPFNCREAVVMTSKVRCSWR